MLIEVSLYFVCRCISREYFSLEMHLHSKYSPVILDSCIYALPTQTFFSPLALQAETGDRIDRTITFRPQDTEIAVNFTVVDDLIALEPTESFNWTLTLITVLNGITIEPYNRTTIAIMDDDGM